MRSANDWIRLLGLSRHPEGGWYREIYRSDETISGSALPDRFGADRAMATSILYLLAGEEFSAFHRLRADEIWSYHAGSGLVLHRILPGGVLSDERLGIDPERGQPPQRIMPAGCWFAVTVEDPASYGLAGCVTAPGFAFDDFELGDRERLTAEYPALGAWIRRLTRESGRGSPARGSPGQS